MGKNIVLLPPPPSDCPTDNPHPFTPPHLLILKSSVTKRTYGPDGAMFVPFSALDWPMWIKGYLNFIYILHPWICRLEIWVCIPMEKIVSVKRIMRPDDIKQNGECVKLMKLLTWACIVLWGLWGPPSEYRSFVQISERIIIGEILDFYTALPQHTEHIFM